MIHELVLEESNVVFVKDDELSFERCHCGSSLVRITHEQVHDGMEYRVVCAKCGDEVFCITDTSYIGDKNE